MLLGIFTLSSAQSYPGYDRDYQDGWVGDDDYYFPEDYYYDYPSDYYTDDYYHSFYNDYRKSVTGINWNRFFREMRLSPWQISMILDLNNQFPSYGVWNSYYRSNPNRWYYDRYYALERILGPRIYVVFQNRYYRGYNPVNYYINYWRDYYQPSYYTYYVVPRYRNINVNVYRVNRKAYHQSVGNRYGWNQPRNSNNASFGNSSQGTLRQGSSSNQGTLSARNNQISTSRSSANSGSTGLRNGTVNGTVNRAATTTSTQRSSGLRSGSTVNSSSSRSTTSQPAVRTSSGARSQGNSGFRSGSANRSTVSRPSTATVRSSNRSATVNMSSQSSSNSSSSGNRSGMRGFR